VPPVFGVGSAAKREMYIGQLNINSIDPKGSYQFFRRGTGKPFPPDITPDTGDAKPQGGEIPFGTESLGQGAPVGWKWNSLMDTGVDIRINFGQAFFIGAVCLELTGRSGVAAVEVFSLAGESGAHNNTLTCVGRLDAGSGHLLNGEITVPIGVWAATLVVRLQADLKDIVISKLAVIGAEADEPDVYPTPKSLRYQEGELPLSALKAIMIPASDSAAAPAPTPTTAAAAADVEFVASFIKERLRECFGVDLPIITSSGQAPSAIPSANPAAPEGTITIALDAAIKPNGYGVRVHAGGVELVASQRIGLLYAAETLVQLAQKGTVPFCEVDDEPRCEVRGFHFGLPPREEIPFMKRLIRYVLIPMRYNTIFIEFAGGMRFDRHPEISEAWVQGNRAAAAGLQPKFPHGDMVAGGELLEKDEVREFVAYCKQFGFEVIPEVQSFGHTQYITYAHPEIAEVAEEAVKEKKLDTRLADQPPSTHYYHTYCPLHEKSYEIIYDIIDEIVEVVRPERYVHMGHDEIYQIGLCPRCQGKDHAELYELHVRRMYEYLAKKGLKMMIWCDMLQPTERYKTHPARERLPRDIVLLDFIWYFHFDLDLEDNLLPYGYKIIMGNMYSSHYPRFEQRIAKEGMIGGEVSTWCRCDEYTLAKKGKIFDLLYSAEMLWSETYDSRAREIYTAWITKRLPRLRDELRGIAKPFGHQFTSRAISLPALPASSALPAALAEALQRTPTTLWSRSFDFTNAQRLTTTPIEVPVRANYDKLVFLHATANNAMRIAWQPLKEVGRYIVRYADGSQVEIPVEYAGNICVYTRRYGQPLPQQYYRHQGYIATYWGDPLLQAKTGDGRDVTALGFEWVNPHPEREIAAILCCGNGETDADILLLGISGINI